MAEAVLTDPIFHDETAARAHFEKLRWEGGGPVCFHCGVVGDAAPIVRDDEKAATRKKAGKKVQREGLYYCRSCGGQFTATMGTVYEDSHIPLHKWLLATHLMNSCKRGVSAAELQRQLGLGSYRTAWFMAHRIREGMPPEGGPLGGEGKVVEVDESYHGRVKEPLNKTTRGRPYVKRGSGPANKRAIVALVERGGKSKVFHVGTADKETIARIITENVHPASRLHTDESQLAHGTWGWTSDLPEAVLWRKAGVDFSASHHMTEMHYIGTKNPADIFRPSLDGALVYRLGDAERDLRSASEAWQAVFLLYQIFAVGRRAADLDEPQRIREQCAEVVANMQKGLFALPLVARVLTRSKQTYRQALQRLIRQYLRERQ